MIFQVSETYVCLHSVCLFYVWYFNVTDNIGVELLTFSRSIASLLTNIDARGQVFSCVILAELVVIVQMGTDAILTKVLSGPDLFLSRQVCVCHNVSLACLLSL